MGVVYRARDSELDRDVALKVVRAAGGGADAQETFIEEGRALAKLSHPSVVPVYDVGSTEHGVYLVMPFVSGGTLYDWLRGARRPWRAVIDRFIAAGRGLEAAHRAGIVHRDFKPQNVLLGGAGEVLVADFGIAARVSGSHSEPSIARPAGTRAYMAPEQVEGGTVDARADQYSFCVSLWEALQGELPSGVRTGKRAAPAWLLDVLARGFAAEREQRWPSMTALLDHVEGRLRRRRRIAVGLGAFSVGAVAATVIWFSRGAPSASCPDPGPRLAGVWDSSIKRSIETAFRQAAPTLADATLAGVMPLLEGYATSWRTMQVEACEATHVRHSQPAEVLDRRQVCLDRRLSELRAFTGALSGALTQDFVIRAWQAVSSLPDIGDCARTAELLAAQPLPASPEVRARIEAVDRELDTVRTLKWNGKHKEQLRLSQEALVAARAIEYPPLLARALQVRSSAELDNDVRGASALRELARVAAEAHDDRATAVAWIDLINYLTNVEVNLPEAKTIEPVAEAAVTRAGGGADLRYHFLRTVGSRAMGSGELDVAIGRFDEALEVAPDRFRRAEAQQFRAKVLFQQQGPAAAEPLAEQVLTDYEAVLGREHPQTANVIEFLAQLSVVAGDFPTAEARALRALAISEATFGPDHPSASIPLQVLGFVAGNTGRATEARVWAERGVRVMEKAGDPVRLAASLAGLGDIIFAQNGIVAARPHLERALNLIEKAKGKDNLSYVRAENILAGRLVQSGDCRAAEPFIVHAVTVLEAKRPALLSLPLMLRGQCAQTERRFEDARIAFERATELCAKHGCEPTIGLPALALYGQLLVETGHDRKRGLDMIYQARAGFEKHRMADAIVESDRWMKAHGIRRR